MTKLYDTSLTSHLVIGQPEIIYHESRMPYTMDGSWASLREDDGTMTFFETALGKLPYYFRHSGTPDDPLQKELTPFVWDYNGYNHSHLRDAGSTTSTNIRTEL